MSDIEKKHPPLSDPPPEGTRTPEDVNLKPESDEDLEDTRERIMRQHQEELQARGDLKQQDIPVLPFTQFFGKKKDFDLDEVATQPSVYDNEAAAAYFQPHENYENKHRFDPKCRWTWREELPLINKMDLKSM